MSPAAGNGTILPGARRLTTVPSGGPRLPLPNDHHRHRSVPIPGSVGACAARRVPFPGNRFPFQSLPRSFSGGMGRDRCCLRRHGRRLGVRRATYGPRYRPLEARKSASISTVHATLKTGPKRIPLVAVAWSRWTSALRRSRLCAGPTRTHQRYTVYGSSMLMPPMVYTRDNNG